ncbi:hypothetical protein LH51_09470 [Nitrincola sp. A-D6]|uniref:DUF2798 domain-containing protein n=1 Tax=Nitrincola sp. A-D6 TaxID=1545442 RepID=UPI00051FAC10|nr:DUF2798 domain-containing protein [Nitrincola sp. A-D6]KGK42143.1 hypothetical protein LH51_09470 [Nitrincola sp. A-D6]
MFFSARYQRLVFTFLMSVYMVFIMTCVITLVNTGFTEGFALRWFKAFIVAWPVAFVLILIGAPRLQTLAGKLIKQA